MYMMDSAYSLLKYGYGIVFSSVTMIISISRFLINSIYFILFQPIINIFKVLFNLFILLPINSGLYLIFGTQLHLLFGKNDTLIGYLHYLFDLSLILYQFFSMALIVGLSCGISIGIVVFFINSMLTLQNTSFELFSVRSILYNILDYLKITKIWNFLCDISRLVTGSILDDQDQHELDSKKNEEKTETHTLKNQEHKADNKENEFIKENFKMDTAEFKKFLTSDISERKKTENIYNLNQSKATSTTGSQRYKNASFNTQVPKQRKGVAHSSPSLTASHNTSFYEDDDGYGYDLIVQPIEASTPRRGSRTLKSNTGSSIGTNTLNTTDTIFSNTNPADTSTTTTTSSNKGTIVDQKDYGLETKASKDELRGSSNIQSPLRSRIMESLIEVTEEESNNETDNDNNNDEMQQNSDQEEGEEEFYETSEQIN